MAGATQTIRQKIFPTEGGREVTTPLHSQLLAQQPTLPQLPVPAGHDEPRAVHPPSLLLP